jgi:hypothetical protein
MSFDRLAPCYLGMEWALAGRKMHRCRTAFLARVPTPHNILICGEGPGRSLVECRRRFPAARILVVEESGRMIAAARTTLIRAGLSPDHIGFAQVDALEWTPPGPEFDLIITHFFLDCFTPAQLTRLVPAIARAAAPGSSWLIADFALPPRGPARWRARTIHEALYLFFRAVTGLSARRLTPPDALLSSSGFQCRGREVIEWGLLQSDWWRAPG